MVFKAFLFPLKYFLDQLREKFIICEDFVIAK